MRLISRTMFAGKSRARNPEPARAVEPAIECTTSAPYPALREVHHPIGEGAPAHESQIVVTYGPRARALDRRSVVEGLALPAMRHEELQHSHVREGRASVAHAFAHLPQTPRRDGRAIAPALRAECKRSTCPRGIQTFVPRVECATQSARSELLRN